MRPESCKNKNVVLLLLGGISVYNNTNIAFTMRRRKSKSLDLLTILDQRLG